MEDLRNIYKDLNISVLYHNKRVYIPITKISCGYITTDEKYPYIKRIATPWDLIHKNYNADKSDYECGISIAAINYLCENNIEFKDALRWFLPDFEIT